MSELALNSKLPQEQADISIGNMKKGFASGPLDSYRRQASFDWFEMKVFVEGGEDVVEFKNNIWNTLAKDPLFDRANDSKLSFGERRRLTMKRCTKLAEYNFVTDDDVMANPFFVQAFTDAIGSFDWSLSTKYLLNRTVSEKLVKPVVTIVDWIEESINSLGVVVRGRVLLGILGGGVPPGSPNPHPISDPKMSFSAPVFRPDLLYPYPPYPLSDLAFRQKLCYHYLEGKQTNL